MCANVGALHVLSGECVCSIKNAELGLLFCFAVLGITAPVEDDRWEMELSTITNYSASILQNILPTYNILDFIFKSVNTILCQGSIENCPRRL